MKTMLTTFAVIAALAGPAMAGGLSDPIRPEARPASLGLDLSDRNDALTHRVMCSNVPARNGSVAGVLVPNIGYFVEETSAPYATTDRIAGVIPAHLSSKDAEEITAYFESVGLTNFELVIRDDTERFYEEIEVPVDHPVSEINGYMKTVVVTPKEPETETIRVLVRTSTRSGKWCR